MTIEFSGETSYTKYHSGTLISDTGQEHDFTLIEDFQSNIHNATYEVVWPDGPPHNYKNLEKAIINQFNLVKA
jgi:hypothetical protein